MMINQSMKKKKYARCVWTTFILSRSQGFAQGRKLVDRLNARLARCEAWVVELPRETANSCILIISNRALCTVEIRIMVTGPTVPHLDLSACILLSDRELAR